MENIHVKLGIILIAFLLLQGCGSGDLSRGEAKELIKNQSDVAKLKSYVSTHRGAEDQGIKQEYWKWNREGRDDIVLTSKGRKHFSRTAVSLYELVGVYLKKTTDGPTIKINGIAKEGENEHRANFSWRYDYIPSVAKRFAVTGGRGIAKFQRYDDGWRIDDLDLSFSERPLRLSPEERKAE